MLIAQQILFHYFYVEKWHFYIYRLYKEYQDY